MSGDPPGEPGSKPGADRIAATPLRPDENGDDIIQGGGSPRRPLPRGLVVGCYLVCGAAALVWVGLMVIDRVGDPVATPTPTIAGEAPDELPFLPPTPTQSGGPIEPGRHSLTVAGVPFSFGLPNTPDWENGDAWTRYSGNYISKSSVGPQGAEAVIYWTDIEGVRGIASCGQWWGSPDGSLSDFASRAARKDGTERISGPSNVTLGGVAAKRVVLIVRKDAGCDPGYFYTWRDVPSGPWWPTTDVGDRIRIWLVDVDGTRLFVAAETKQNAGPRLTRELQQIVESIRFR